MNPRKLIRLALTKYAHLCNVEVGFLQGGTDLNVFLGHEPQLTILLVPGNQSQIAIVYRDALIYRVERNAQEVGDFLCFRKCRQSLLRKS